MAADHIPHHELAPKAGGSDYIPHHELAPEAGGRPEGMGGQGREA
jgi:hypothetical protein